MRAIEYRRPAETISASAATEGNVSRPDGSVLIGRIESDSLVETLTRHAHFYKYDRREEDWLPADCPAGVARMVLARAGFGWDGIPQLRAITQAPVLRKDGSAVLAPGYDEATGLLLITSRLWPQLPEAPDKVDAQAAIRLLERPLRELPFVAESDRSAAIALLITAVLRPVLASAPMFAVSAPAAGTGKSLTINIASILATGRTPAVVTPTPDDAELEKRIGAAALAGDPVITLDNVSHALRSDLLCQLLTEPEIQVRILGRSENAKIPSTALMCCTGNNLTIVGDLNRRVVRIRLDAACERPEERAFSFDAIDYALRHRAELVVAALTVVRAYILAGFPSRAPAFGSFADWSDTVRSALMWCGKADPRGNLEEQRGEDPEKIELAEVMDALPATPFTVKEVARLIGENAELRAALSNFVTPKTGMLNRHSLGSYLRRKRDVLVGDRSIQLLKSDAARGSVWHVGKAP